MRADLRSVDGAGRQHHAVARRQFQALTRTFEHEGDGAVQQYRTFS